MSKISSLKKFWKGLERPPTYLDNVFEYLYSFFLTLPLKNFMQFLCPKYQVPSSTTMSNNEVVQWGAGKANVAITTDGGSSSNAVSFQDVNCHYFSEDW